MDRRRAMAVAGASTAVLASVAIAYAATMSVGWLGFGSHATTRRVTNAAQVVPAPMTSTEDPSTTTTAVEPQVVVEQRDVFDRQVVVVPTDATAPAPASTESDGEEDRATSTTSTTATTVTRAASTSSSTWSQSEDSHDSEHSLGEDD